MICEDYKTHRGVTGPMKCKSRTFFFGKSCSRVFWAPGCHPSNLIDLANTALASKSSLKTICMISSGYRTHRGVTGPMNFEKSGGFFFGKWCTREFGAPVCHPMSLIDLSNTALAFKSLAKTICMISEGYRTHRGVTGPMNFKSRTFIFFGKSCFRRFWGPWLPSKHFN